mmetsp:Transcript_53236/g.140869  ORF Transcript_53236/g.140869 Transcript_53236/m.140869 type:complete len:200 (-) Transcript_53236:235-834(-)
MDRLVERQPAPSARLEPIGRDRVRAAPSRAYCAQQGPSQRQGQARAWDARLEPMGRLGARAAWRCVCRVQRALFPLEEQAHAPRAWLERTDRTLVQARASAACLGRMERPLARIRLIHVRRVQLEPSPSEVFISRTSNDQLLIEQRQLALINSTMLIAEHSTGASACQFCIAGSYGTSVGKHPCGIKASAHGVEASTCC